MARRRGLAGVLLTGITRPDVRRSEENGEGVDMFSGYGGQGQGADWCTTRWSEWESYCSPVILRNS